MFSSMLTFLALAVTITSALPRGQPAGDEIFQGLYRDQQPGQDKDGPHLDTIDGVSLVQPVYRHRYYKKEGGGTLDSLGGGHLIRNLQGHTDNYEHEIKKEAAIKTDSGMNPRRGNLLRDLEAVLRENPNLFYGRSARNLDSLSGITFGSQKRYDNSSPMYSADKRNFDEIDRSGFNSFIKKKKNFDEIDRAGFDGFVKRNFDEIDRVGFGSFIKKSDADH